MNSLIQSEDGASLEFSVLGFTQHDTGEVECRFIARVRNGKFHGEVEADTYSHGPPSQLFNKMAENWRGWDGPFHWSDLEDRLALVATMNPTGHVTLEITLRHYDSDSLLQTSLSFLAGELEHIASGLNDIFDDQGVPHEN